jgi:hypothetical protein
MRVLREVLVCTTLVTVAGGAPFSWAQSASSMGGATVGGDPQIVNAAQAAEEALKAAATSGESTRGASGSIASLLTSSDSIICSGWIVTFRTQYRNMVINGADVATLQAMQTLMEKVEQACDRILNPETSAGAAPGGGGAVEPEQAEPAIYPYCPQCDPFKRTLDRRIYQHQVAQYELNQAMRRTDFLERVYASNATPEEKRVATGGETVYESEVVEGRKMETEIRARWAVESAREALVDCLERCNTANQQHSSLGGNATKYALAAGAGTAVAVALAASGGSESGGSAEAPVTAATTTAGVAPTASGVAACAGTYNATFTVSSDPDNHRDRVRMAQNVLLTVTIASIHIRGSEPFIEVSGSIDPTGNFDATGIGTAAGFSNVAVRMEGTLRGCGTTTGAMSGVYSMGVSGEFPGGRPISYAVQGTQ